jgi:hypothetical protein
MGILGSLPDHIKANNATTTRPGRKPKRSGRKSRVADAYTRLLIAITITPRLRRAKRCAAELVAEVQQQGGGGQGQGGHGR